MIDRIVDDGVFVKQIFFITVIDFMNICKINLNLLIAFDVLMTERHVSRASEKLCISQSATSNALKRLRELFNDELLIKTPLGMEPTTRALELIDSIHEVIDKAQAVFAESEKFDPSKTDRTLCETC